MMMNKYCSSRDHRINNFPGFDHIEWEKKRKHVEYVNKLAAEKGGDVKVIAVYTGLFLDDSLDVSNCFTLRLSLL